MNLLRKIKEYCTERTSDVKYFLVSVTPRAIYQQNDKGGVLITIRFEKTVTKFGKSKILTDTVTFNNYHGHGRDAYGDRTFTYNPPYVARKDAHSEDSLWHAMLVWDDCETYPFAPITTRQLNLWIDDWAAKHTCFTCCHCGYRQSAHFDVKAVDCPACNKKVAVPHTGEPAFA